MQTMPAKQKIDRTPMYRQWIDFGNDMWPDIENEATAQVIEVAASETHEGILHYTVLLVDKMNLKQPMAFDMTVSADGIRLIAIAQAGLEDLVHNYPVVSEVWQEPPRR